MTTSKRKHHHDNGKCKGLIMENRAGHKDITTGFGDGGAGKFQVDFIRVKAVDGFCLKCKASGIFQERKGKCMTRYPRAINAKLNKIRI